MPKYVLIGLIVVVGTFLIMNYWPKLKEQTKNRILMVIFGIFFISIFGFIIKVIRFVLFCEKHIRFDFSNLILLIFLLFL